MEKHFAYINNVFLEITQDLFYEMTTGVLINYQGIPEEDFYRIYMYSYDYDGCKWSCVFKHTKDYLNTIETTSVGKEPMSFKQKLEAKVIAYKLLKFCYEHED